MTDELAFLTLTAASIGLLHTLVGPDHYVPFIALGTARGWTLRKTLGVTALCGLGHVLSSVALGLVGVILGVAVSRLEAIESSRANLAAWMLIVVGFVYFAWGLHRALRSTAHRHAHAHDRAGLTPWMLFLVFVLGPCEPLIPVLMYPAATLSVWGVVVVTGVFAVVTLATMLGVVALGLTSARRLPTHHLEHYSHALAGAAILLCGVGIRFLGL